jgi:DNA-binding NarL/FixJ family response regulator
MPTRVVLADDRALMRGGLAAAMASAPVLVLAGEAEYGQEAAEMVRTQGPDVVLVDLVMRESNGIQAIHAIVDNHARTELPAWALGVLTLVVRGFRNRQIVAAIGRTATGRTG